ncbi:MAG: hypothetical protein AAB966_00120 [Patescibacteria group bacterium]
MSKINLQIGVPLKLDISSRYFEFNRDYAIRDIYDALVELITNADDSYHRLYVKKHRPDDGGAILVEIGEQRKGGSSILIVRDRAEGMTLEVMYEKLYHVGERHSSEGDRGFMGRGAKDCTALGNVTYESIKDDRYYKCQLTARAEFVPITGLKGEKINESIRKSLRIERGNGTVVTIEIASRFKIPHTDTIARDLPWYYSLRDILSEDSPTKLLLRNLNHPEKSIKAIHWNPKGQQIINEPYSIPGYDGVTAKFILWKADESFDDPNERFRRSGILIKGKRAIFECSLFVPGFEKDDHAKRYFGRVVCPHIDLLLNDYDNKRKNDLQQSEDNPTLVIDPNRISGLRREHPFTMALFQHPITKLKELIEKDKEQDRSKQKEVANKETQNRLDELAKEASKFLSQQVEEFEEYSENDDVDEEYFSKRGVMIYPTYFNLAVGQVRTLTFYVNKRVFDTIGFDVRIKSDDPAITVLDYPFKLREHRTRVDRLIGSFRVKGNSLKDTVCLQTENIEMPKAEAIANVIDAKVEEHLFNNPLEFEHKQYIVKEGSSKTIRIFAKYPEVVSEPIQIQVTSSDVAGLPVKGITKLIPMEGTNFAVGEANILGRRQGGSSTLEAKVNGHEASTKIKVVQKDESGIPLKFKLVPHSLGVYRAVWSIQQPNVLEISAAHDSIKRYLGSAPDYDGQNLPHFRVLLAEIVAERICMKALELEVKSRPWDFKDDFNSSPDIVVNTVISHLQKRLRDFVAKAHQIMFSQSDLKLNS